MEGSQEVTKSENCVVLTPSISPAHFFPPCLSLKRSGTSATLIKTINMTSFAACLCPARVQGVQTALSSARPVLSSAQLLAARPPQAKPTQQHNSSTTISEQPALGPALYRFTSHNTTFTQPNSFCGFCPSQNTLVQSPNVFLVRPDTEHNDIFRDRPWLSKMQCF